MKCQKLLLLFMMLFSFAVFANEQSVQSDVRVLDGMNFLTGQGGSGSTGQIPSQQTSVGAQSSTADLKSLDLFDMLDVFFTNFIVPINRAGEGFDTEVDYENLYKLYSSKNRAFMHMINSIETQMNQMNLNGKSEDFKKAFYINAYNYGAISVIMKNYKRSNGNRIRSIRDLSNSRFNRFKIFKRKFIGISGTLMSLDDVEKDKLIKLMSRNGRVIDARFHFAVICASGGCPVTLNKAYRAETLEENLDFITREGLRLPRILKRNGSSLGLTKIISEWYTGDFISDSGSVVNFLSKHGVSNTSGRISKLSYDWNLNILKTPRSTPTLSELEVR